MPAASAEPSAAEPPASEPRGQVAEAPPARPDPARAEQLFREGRLLMEQGRHAEACERFAASFELDPAIGTLLNLGACAERSGDTERACAHFAAARDLARDKGQVERERFASSRLSALGCQ